jgi:ribosomal-protein-serine acetyltransferase
VHQHNHSQATIFATIYRDKLLGIAGFNYFDYQHKWGAIGYWLCSSYNGKGVMTKVVEKLLEYGFVDTRLNKI